MVRHIENLGIIRTVYSDIFRHIQEHSATFSHVQGCFQGYLGVFRVIDAYSATLTGANWA